MSARDGLPGDASTRTASVRGSDDSFPDWLSFRASTAPQRIALEAGTESWTYLELDAEATALARQLLELGAVPGDRVATLLRNGAAPVVLVHAVLRLGATLVPLNTRLRDVELAFQLADSGARLLVAEEATLELAEAAFRAPAPDGSPRSGGVAPGMALVTATAKGRISVVGHATDGSEREAPAAHRGPGTSHASSAALRLVHPASHILAIMYTSGTTGQPKGAQLTVGNFWWSALGSALNLGVHLADRWLAVLPLFHIGGLSIALRSAIHGTTMVVHPGFDAGDANHAIDEQGITIVSVVSVMLQRMLDARNDRPYPPSLRCVLLGGGPAPLALLERCAAAGIPVAQTYGLTEACSQVATLSPGDALRKPGSSGRPLYPNAIRIALADGTEAAQGEAGEILVRGPIVMAGYRGQPPASGRGGVDGWLHTGDVGTVDDDGYLHVLDRRDDLIISGGENIYPAEVEGALLAHPSVAEAGVIGVPDDEWGQRVVAVVRLVDDPDAAPHDVAEVLQRHCRSLLAGYKVPREFRISREPLPRTASGKLRRGELRAER